MALEYKPEHKVSKFKGILTKIKDLREVPDGFSPDQRNWMTLNTGGGIELRRGTALLGSTRNTGSGKITGLGIGTRFDGVQIPFFTYGRKAKYYDEDADNTVEIGSDLLPAAADGEDVSIFPYQNLAGAFVYFSSRNSSVYKVPVANPGSAVDQLSTTYRGFLKFGQARSFLFNRNGSTPGNSDKSSLYTSRVDKVSLSQYPAQTTGESVGSSGSQNYTHTLSAISAKRTAMFVTVSASVAAGTETFVDDRDGNLVSNFGGTGTVNYATGAIDVTFSAVTTGAVTCAYYYEDATSGGVVDFSISNPSDRQPGEGNIFPQFDGGGNLNSVYPLSTVFYCFHELKTWQVVIPTDDGASDASIFTNLPFREKMGVKNPYAAFGGEEGVYLINTADKTDPKFMKLQLLEGGTQANIAAPRQLSPLIDFNPYVFDQAAVHEAGDLILLSCQQVRNGITDDFNSITFVLNKVNDAWDILDYPVSRFATWLGGTLAGDPLSDNVFTIFSGFDDDGEAIPNYWTSGQSDLEMLGIKRFTRFVAEGLIQGSQRYRIQMSFDGGAFVTVGIVDGSASYVDTSASIAVGSQTLGSKISGGGSTVYANPYRAEFTVQSPRFTYVRMRFEASILPEDPDAEQIPGGGYVSIHSYAFKDIRQKSLRSLPEKTV